jgi:hypothetical protein
MNDDGIKVDVAGLFDEITEWKNKAMAAEMRENAAKAKFLLMCKFMRTDVESDRAKGREFLKQLKKWAGGE